MRDPWSNTQEFRSGQWDLVLQYEDGSLPATAWTIETLTTVAVWYAKNVTREQATTRYEKYYHRNRHRLINRLGNAAVATDAIEAIDAVWESLLADALANRP